MSTRKKVIISVVAVVTLLGLGVIGFMIPKIMGGNSEAGPGVAAAAPMTEPTSNASSTTKVTPSTTTVVPAPAPVETKVTPTSKELPPPVKVTPPPVSTQTFYGLTLPMDPKWKVLNETDTSTYIGSTDPAKMCHSLEESCPSLRIFNYQASAADVANSYADCDAVPVPAGTKTVGGLAADYLVAKPCHEVSVQLLPDEHRIYVIPGKLVLVVVLVDGQTLDNLEAALAGATW